MEHNTLEEWKQLCEHWLQNEEVPEVWKTYLRFVQNLPDDQRDPKDESLSVYHIEEEQPLPLPIAQGLEAWWLHMSEEDPFALNQLGVLYYAPRSPLQNLEKSLRMYQAGAAAGEIYCLLNLGFFYRYDHQVVPVDEYKAWTYFARAALFGLADGMLQLAIMLEEGIGTEPDWHSAFGLYNSLYQQLESDESQAMSLSAAMLGMGRILSEHPEAEATLDSQTLLEQGLDLIDEYDLLQADPMMAVWAEDAQNRLQTPFVLQ